MTQTILQELEVRLNAGSMPQHIIEGRITKGAFDAYGKYKFVVNSNDHLPPHFHVSVNNKQIAKYSLETGRVITSSNPRLDKIVEDWFSKDGRVDAGLAEWRKFHGDKR